MSPLLVAAIAALCVAVGMLIHKYFPGFSVVNSVAKVEAAVVDEVHKIAPTLKAEALAAVTHAEHWLVSTVEEDALIAKADALKATALAAKAAKVLMIKAHVATLSAALPPTDPVQPPAPPVA